MNCKPLPRRPAPFQDELLSSWLARLADANYCAVPELCRYLGLAQEHPPEMLADLASVDVDRFCTTLRLPSNDLDSMLLKRRKEFAVECVSWSDFQKCRTCTSKQPGISLRHWRFSWSLQCEVCGSELVPLRGDSEGLAQPPSGLRRRAQEGARYLMIAYRQGNVHSGRRMDLTLQVAGVLAPKLRHGAKFSQSRLDRHSILAAINLGMTRPLLAVALVMKNDPRAERRLRATFPHKRKLVDRLASLVGDLPLRSVRIGENHKTRSKKHPTCITSSPKPEYLAAARQAITELGATADGGELLRVAESILQTARR
ncbi:hypothetical protein G5B38_19530 (plasmid) [Pseudohalocynthiibacter aestuariivivens]|uniref:TniQ family protein n=1 Tax=Roseovarius pelagicus TaxID=2980108 RepID=A0ABY6D691_9RHOB|nr:MULTISPECIES: TniQ family protein [Rhodobacterales]QIE47831.1 hypothetical protein G5B38_19530 [Pseudohalocynthiibacter aestuariivivens]UXX81429.1 TniQ family protein [Roseovarius pelagicus]